MPARTPDFLRQPTDRLRSIDILRGLIMIVMALDHASVSWNAGRPHLLEFALEGLPLTEYPSLAQQVTREITHLCAPGFQLLAGMGLAISVLRRRRGAAPNDRQLPARASASSEWRISGDMVLRGLVLLACDWILLYPIFGSVPFFFMVLCCIGSAMIIFSVARLLPTSVILLASIAVLLAGPLYAPSAIVPTSLSLFPRNILTNIAFNNPPAVQAFFVLYPILPWVGFFGVGWWLGTVYERGGERRLGWVIALGFVTFLAGITLRWLGGAYGDRFPGGELGPLHAGFWLLAKYPPSPAFCLITLGALLGLLGCLRALDLRPSLGRAWRFPEILGRVALFFFVVHMYVYGVGHMLRLSNEQRTLALTYAVWLVGLAALWPICVLYDRLRVRYRGILRYF